MLPWERKVEDFDPTHRCSEAWMGARGFMGSAGVVSLHFDPVHWSRVELQPT